MNLPFQSTVQYFICNSDILILLQKIMDQEEIVLYKNLDVSNGRNFEIKRSPEKGR